METADSVTFHKCVCRHTVFRGLWCVAGGPPADPADPTDSADSAGSLRARRKETGTREPCTTRHPAVPRESCVRTGPADTPVRSGAGRPAGGMRPGWRSEGAGGRARSGERAPAAGRARRTGPGAAACLAEGPGTGHPVRMSRAAHGANLGNATGTGPDRTRTEPNRTRQGQNGPEPNHKERKEPQ